MLALVRIVYIIGCVEKPLFYLVLAVHLSLIDWNAGLEINEPTYFRGGNIGPKQRNAEHYWANAALSK